MTRPPRFDRKAIAAVAIRCALEGEAAPAAWHKLGDVLCTWLDSDEINRLADATVRAIAMKRRPAGAAKSEEDAA